MLQPNKILVIRFSSLGDLILTSPIFRELRRIFPGANLNLLTSVGFGDVLDNNPHLDRIIKHPRKENFEQLNQLIEELQAEEFDLIYDAHRSMRSRWIVSRLTAFGMKRKPAVWKINKRTLNRKLLIHLGWNRLQQGLSQREQWLLPLKQHAPHGLDASTELFPDQEDIDLIETLMSEHNLLTRGFIAIGPSASQPR
ncbi:MAG: glycosyltransferase family 9 protein, partial [SAR324 cluster bacterium]|nr:glycosyltransferase family 9 protein [SAR324 cluster bacterium]